MLLETIEKGNLGEKSKSKKCSRKVVSDISNRPPEEKVPAENPGKISQAEDKQSDVQDDLCDIRPKNLVSRLMFIRYQSVVWRLEKYRDLQFSYFA